MLGRLDCVVRAAADRRAKHTSNWARIASGSDSVWGSIARVISPASPVNAAARGGVGQSWAARGSGITLLAV